MSDERYSSVPLGDRVRDCLWTPVLQQPMIVKGPSDATACADELGR